MDISNFQITARFQGKHEFLIISGRRENVEEGLRYLSFYLSEEDVALFKTDVFAHTLTDCNHRLNISGDRLTFYDLDIPCLDNAGTMKVPYYEMHFPLRAREMIVRLADRALDELRTNFVEGGYDSKTEIIIVGDDGMISPERFFKLCVKYRQSAGSVQIHIPDDLCSRFEVDSENPEFVERIARLTQISKNSTHAPEQRAHLFIYPDGKSYSFGCRNHHHKNIMFGGLINHGKDSEPSWSIYT